MAFNGSGTFARIHNWVTDKANSVKITASRQDTEDDGFATGLSNTICRDGQSTISANIPFNSKKITGLAAGTTAGDSVRYEQVALVANDLSDLASASTAATNLGLGTGDSPQFTAVNIGHATDTTLARVSAGVLSVEGNTIYHATGTDVPVTDGGTGASTAAGARTNLAAAGTGVANTFTASQTIAQATPSVVVLQNTTATPAAGTVCGQVRYTGQDDGGNTTPYARIDGVVDDDTDTSEDGYIEFRTTQNGIALGNKLSIGGGVYTPNATGGDQAIDTINAKAVYDDGVLLCAPIEDVKLGSFDKVAWTALAPHGAVTVYETMKARGYVPGSADSFADEVTAHEGIPGYWNQAEWEARLARTKKDDKGRDIIDRVSHAEVIERLLLVNDLQALAIVDLTNRVKALEAA
jgi:hypothetical protein